MMNFIVDDSKYRNGDALEFPAREAQKKQDVKPPFWTLIKRKALQTDQLFMDLTDINNGSEKWEKEATSWKDKYNLQLERATKLDLDIKEKEKAVQEHKQSLESQQIKLKENEQHIIQLKSRVESDERKIKSLKEAPKPRVTKNKAIPTKHQECQTMGTCQQDIAVNTDPIQIKPVKPQMKDFSTTVNFTNPIPPKPQVKDFSATVNFQNPIPKKPVMIDKNEWTDECITISKEPFPIFCSKCKSHISPAPIDQILKVMTAQPPEPLSMVPPTSNLPKVKTEMRPTVCNVIDDQTGNQMHREDKNLPTNDDQFAIKNVKEPKCSTMSAIEKLTKRVAKLEKSMKKANKKTTDSSSESCCQKNIQFVVKYPDVPLKREKRSKKRLKRLNQRQVGSKKDDCLLANKWLVENCSKPKRVKVLHPKKKSLKSTLTSQCDLDDLFESPAIDFDNGTQSIPNPHLLNENSFSSNLSFDDVTMSKGEENIDISEKSSQDVNISKFILPETEIHKPSTSQISLYKYSYPSSIEKEFDRNSVSNVQPKKKASTCENDVKGVQEVNVNKQDVNEKSLQEVAVNEQAISGFNLPITSPFKQDMLKVNLIEQSGTDCKQVEDVSENSVSLNALPSSKEISYLDDKNTRVNDLAENQILSEKSKGSSFSDILSYPVVFGESDVSEEELAVCNMDIQKNRTAVKESVPNSENNAAPQTTDGISRAISSIKLNTKLKEKNTAENELLKDTSFVNDKTYNQDFMFASPALNSIKSKIDIDIQSNNSSPHDVPSSSGIPITPEYPSIKHPSYKTFQAKVLFMESSETVHKNNFTDKIDDSEIVKSNTSKYTPLTLDTRTDVEDDDKDLCEPQNEGDDRISHFLPISKSSEPPKIPGILNEPRIKMRIRNNKIESEWNDCEIPKAEEDSKIEKQHIVMKEAQSQSNVEVFVIPENVLDTSSLKEKIKSEKQMLAKQKSITNESSKDLSENNTISRAASPDNIVKEELEDSTDDIVSFEELAFVNTRGLLPMKTTKDDSSPPYPIRKVDKIDSPKIEEVDLTEPESDDFGSLRESDTIQALEKGEPSKSSLSPAKKRKQCNEETSQDDKLFKVPAKRGRKKKFPDNPSPAPTSATRKTLMKKIRTLKKTSKAPITAPIVKTEPEVPDVKPELHDASTLPIVKSDETVDNPFFKAKKSVKSPAKTSSSSKSVSTPRKPDDSVIDTTPIKKKRIAHEPKVVQNEPESNEPKEQVAKKPRKSKGPKKVVDESDKLSSILEEYSKTCKERAEYSRQQKEQNSVKAFDTVNLTDLLKDNTKSEPLDGDLLNDNKNFDVKMEIDSQYYPNEKAKVSGGIVSSSVDGDMSLSSIDADAAASTPSPKRELRSRQSGVGRKRVRKTEQLSANHGQSLNDIPDFIDSTNSCLSDTSMLSVLNKNIFTSVNIINTPWTQKQTNHLIKNENFVYGQFAILNETKEWTSKVNDRIVKELTDAVDFKTLAMCIHEYIGDELPDDEDFDKEHTPPAPFMTRSEQKILVLTLSLNKMCPEFIDKVLQGIQFKLFRLREQQKVQNVERLARFLVILNKIKKNRENVRIALCDAFYCLKMRAVDVIDIALSIWSEVFPKYSPDNDIIVKTIVHIVMTLQVNKPYSKLTRLRKLLSGFYNYPNSDYNINNLLVELQNGLQHNVPGVSTAILLICKRMEPEWSAKYIVPGIKNVLMTNRSLDSPLMYENLTLLGNVLRSFSPVNLDAAVSETIDQLCYVLESNAGSDHLQEGIVACLSSITKFKYERIAKALLNWQFKKELRPITRDKLSLFFKWHNSSWWWNFVKANFPLEKKE